MRPLCSKADPHLSPLICCHIELQGVPRMRRTDDRRFGLLTLADTHLSAQAPVAGDDDAGSNSDEGAVAYGDFVRFSVTDLDGIGIEPEKQALCFEPFFQARGRLRAAVVRLSRNAREAESSRGR